MSFARLIKLVFPLCAASAGVGGFACGNVQYAFMMFIVAISTGAFWQSEIREVVALSREDEADSDPLIESP